MTTRKATAKKIEIEENGEEYKKRFDMMLVKLDKMKRIVKEEIVTSILNNQ